VAVLNMFSANTALF